MRTQSPIARVAIVLCCTFAAVAVLGQTTYTWTNAAGGDLAGPTNWTPNGVPNPDDPSNLTPGAGDQILFNGDTPGPLTNVCQTAALTGASGSTVGLYVLLTSSQVSPVTFISSSGLGGEFRLQSITNEAGAGGLTIGDNGSGNTFATFWGGINGQVHELRNDSVNPCTLNSGLRIRFGGGGTHTFTFDGSGDWNVTNDMNNDSGSPSQVTKNGTGTMIWYSTNNPNLQNNGNFGTGNGVSINGGKLILKTSDSFRSPNIGPTGIIDNAYLEYDDVNPAGGGTLSGVISGSGVLQVNSGALTLSGQNTYTGSNILTGGELIAGSAENPGISGPLGSNIVITFAGGTLGYNVNCAFDYSSRFDTSANQHYSIDTGGQFLYYSIPLASAGGSMTKLGAGSLTLIGASSYTGPTTVSVGKLVFQGAMSGNGNITVSDGATLGIFATGTPVSTGTLTLGSASGTTLEFNNVNSTSVAPLAANNIVAAGTQVININSGAFTVGNSYPLLTWSAGNAPAVQLGLLDDFVGNLSTNGNAIQLNIVATAYSWTGAASSLWNLSDVNWMQNGSPAMFTNNAPAVFDDTSTVTNISMATLASPTVVTFKNNTNSYRLTSSGANNLGGNANLIMAGSGTLTLSGGGNTYTGATTINGGILSVSQLANGGSASDIGAASSSAGNLVLDGGTLQNTGGTQSMNRLFTVGASGGTIDNEGPGTLTLNNAGIIAMTGSGARVLTLTGVNPNGDTLASALSDGSGGTSLVKQGTGTWILTGTNTYSGGTTITNGILQVGNGGSNGTVGIGGVQNNSVLVFNSTGTLTVPGAISGTGSITNNGTGTVILANDNSYSGGTTINSGTLQLGNGGPTGSLFADSPIIDNGTLIFNTTGSFYYSGADGAGIISGTGNVIVRTGAARPISFNTYTGWTEIDAGALFQPTAGQTGGLLSSVVTNNGTLLFARQDSGVFGFSGDIFGTGKLMENSWNENPGDSTFTGTNFSTGGLVITGGYLILGDNANPHFGSTSPLGDIVFTNASVSDGTPRGLILNRPDNYTFSNNILGKTVIDCSCIGNPGALILMGSGIVTLIGSNTYQGGTIISNGVLVVGNGGGTGSIGTGSVDNETKLVFNRSAVLSVSNNISGSGAIVQEGAGIVVLSGSNTYTGSTTVSNGMLFINSNNTAAATVVYRGTLGGTGTLLGPVTTAAGTTLAPGASNSLIGTLTISNNLSIGGNVAIEVNKSLAQSNDLVAVSGVLTDTGTGTLTVSNVGPAIAPGDKFTLFSEPLQNGASLTVTGAGITWINNLAVDGSIIVPPPPPTMIFSQSGNSLQISWPGSFKLQSQTNSLNGTNWVDYPGGGTSPVTITINPSNGSVFFRLIFSP